MAKINCPSCCKLISSFDETCPYCKRQISTPKDASKQHKLNNRALQVILGFTVLAVLIGGGIHVIDSTKRKHLSAKAKTIKITPKQYDMLLATSGKKNRAKTYAHDLLKDKKIDCEVKKLSFTEKGIYITWKVLCYNGKKYRLKLKN